MGRETFLLHDRWAEHYDELLKLFSHDGMISITNRNKGFIGGKKPNNSSVCHFRMIYTWIASSSTDLWPPSGMGQVQLFKQRVATLNHARKQRDLSLLSICVEFYEDSWNYFASPKCCISSEKNMSRYLWCPSIVVFLVLWPSKQGHTTANLTEKAIFTF